MKKILLFILCCACISCLADNTPKPAVKEDAPQDAAKDDVPERTAKFKEQLKFLKEQNIWEPAGGNANTDALGNTIIDALTFIKKDSIKNIGKQKQAWILSTSLETQMKADKNYSSVMILVKYDCKNTLASIKRVVYYEKSAGRGKIVINENLDEKFDDVIPNTSVERALNYVCSYEVKK